ncbi:hypothetical protein Back11_55720 [Paenibacillus baekrokdamisoli]|uniref:Uncharacterized protein n=1 Tax=Paenibacillus baekrokdamisoli TaxID=1712516 RepID=A0A3G9IZ67_9BACL|nr:DUF4838 domain-containing protein [Paenibacillus baekrokdamisoli]MBB3071791.1 hypothetical protein [Paenibacillus baekrokdamisoli]BBH24227.1 hypothetical protein Back11_55720 [Paenibacillus baekrokdamisoli]
MITSRKARISILLIICLLSFSFSSLCGAASVAGVNTVELSDSKASDSKASGSVSDIRGNWAERTLLEWLDRGWISGYLNGKFEPNRIVTRGEGFALINRSFGFTEKAELQFSDLSATDWEYDEVAKAVKAGYIKGYGNNSIGSKNHVNRQEAALMIARLLHMDETLADSSISFTDHAKIASWSKSAIQSLVAKGIVKGYLDGSFKPEASITRAEMVVMLDRALKVSAGVQQTTTYDKAGVYGTAEKLTTINGNVVVNKPGITLRNFNIQGDLILAEGIGEGDVSLINVSVKGETSIQGGGVNSIHVVDCTLVHVSVNKSASPVRIVVEGTTSVEDIAILSSALLEELNLTGKGFQNVQVSDKLPPHSSISLTGQFDEVSISAKDIDVHVQTGSRIIRLILNAVVKVYGQGVIQSATISEAAKGSTFERQPESQTGGMTGVTGTNIVNSPNSLTIVDSGAAAATILVSETADKQTLEAADLLVNYIKKSTSAELKIYTIGDVGIPSGGTHIYVGAIAPGSESSVNSQLLNLGADGFVIYPQLSNNSISIKGPSSWGTEFGVIEFLERYVGVRWLLPGPDGEDVPQASKLVIPLSSVRDQPSFISRKFFGTESPATNVEWTKLNRMHDTIRFHHNLNVLFNPAENSDHPEYYPGGVVPATIHGWQPCMNDTTAAAAIVKINAYFAAHPGEISYSLGINDNSNFCEANPSDPHYPNPPALNSLGYLDMSNVYYAWVNKIVEGVLKQYPDKYFGLLAYWNVYDPPTDPDLKLNPRVIPYITDDRLSWNDEAKAEEGHRLTEDWSKKATGLAFYEYLYGFPYGVPRFYPNVMAKNYQYSLANNVVAHVAELFPNFGEGPKPWLSAKLQWNPNQDVDALLNDWYVRAVGQEAAPYLKEYYDHWEQFWSERIFKSEWYLNWANSPNRNNFMNLYDYIYLAEVTDEDLSLSRNLMEQVVKHAGTKAQITRAEKLLDTFEYYEASSLGYMRKAKIEAPTSLQAALNMLTELSTAMEMADKQTALNLASKTDPILYLTSNPIKGTFGWNGTQPGLFSSLLLWLETAPSNEVDAFKVSLNSIAQEGQGPYVKEYALLLLAVLNDAPNLVKNPSFEIGKAGDPNEARNWSHWQNEAEGSFIRTSELSHSGSQSIEVNSVAAVGGLAQNIPITQPGKYGALLRFYVPEDSVTKGTIQWYINLRDKNNNIIDSVITNYMPTYANKGKWVTMEAIFNAPASTVTAEYGPPIWGLKSGDKLYMDDMALYLLDSSVIKPIQVTSVEAELGAIKVGFDSPLMSEPMLADFKVTQMQKSMIEGKAVLSSVKDITPSAISWDELTQTARLTIPVPVSAYLEQSIIYSVSYQNRTALLSNAVELESAAHLTNLLQNPSFEIADGTWWLWKEGTNGNLSRSNTVKRTGDYSLKLEGVASVGGPIQTVTVAPGLYEAVAYYYTPAGSTTGATIQWGLNLRDQNNAIVSSVVTAKEGVAASKGSWKMMETIFEVTAPVNQVQLIFPTWDLQLGETVYLDDIALYRLDAPASKVASVQAGQGALEVVFNQAPATVPELTSFKVEQQSGSAGLVEVTPTAVAWDENTLTATLTIPRPYAASVEKSIVYRVSYEGGAYIEAAPYVVEAATNLSNLVLNPSFENGDAPWWLWKEGANGTISRSGTVTRTGDFSLELDGVSLVGGPIQTVAVEPGVYEAVFYYYTPAGSTTGAAIQWGHNLRDQNGAIVSSVVTEKESVATSNGSWKRMELEFEVTAPVTQVQLSFPTWDLLAGEKLYLDDVALYKLSVPAE